MKYLLGLAMLDGHVFAVGGWEGSSRLDSVERYDPETNTWSPVASLKMAVTSPAVVAHEGKVFPASISGKKLFLFLRLHKLVSVFARNSKKTQKRTFGPRWPV